MKGQKTIVRDEDECNNCKRNGKMDHLIEYLCLISILYVFDANSFYRRIISHSRVLKESRNRLESRMQNH